MLAEPSDLATAVIGSAIKVHRTLGPGLLESVYEICLAHELALRKLEFTRQVQVPVRYEGLELDCAYRADIVVEGRLLLEIKSVDRLAAIHQAQVLTYLKLLGLHQGLILNFNAPKLVDGLRNILI